MILKNDVGRMKDENLMLSAAVKEGDKTRDALTRQMAIAMQQELQLHASNRNFERSPEQVN